MAKCRKTWGKRKKGLMHALAPTADSTGYYTTEYQYSGTSTQLVLVEIYSTSTSTSTGSVVQLLLASGNTVTEPLVQWC
jgi:hypothetical protein